MKRIFTSFLVGLCGLITSVLTALLVIYVQDKTGFAIFSFSLWVVIPIGAFLVGFVASSGYYVGSRLTHHTPDLSLLAQMVLITIFAQWLIYYIPYSTMVLDNGQKVSDLAPFSKYLSIILTTTHYSVGRTLQNDTGEVGSFGYWLAFFQFLGFVLGSVGVWGHLSSIPVCIKCDKFLNKLGSKTKLFANSDDFAQYYDGIFKIPVDTQDFASVILEKRKVPVTDGVINLHENLYGCSKCKDQAVINTVQVFRGKEWKDAEKLKRRTNIPSGLDLEALFAKDAK